MKRYIQPLVLIISVVTVLSGITQMLKPDFVLRFVGGEITPTTIHFFAIIGMFMMLFGGLMIQTIYSTGKGTAAILWCALQKLGASIAVFIGIAKGLFEFQAGAVALFDLLSALIFLYYLKMRRSE